MAIPFIHEMDIAHGKADRLSPLVRRVVAPNPGPFTFRGTNTYIIGEGKRRSCGDRSGAALGRAYGGAGR